MKRLAISLLLAVAIGLPAHADIFLDIPDIPGESTDSQHPEEIEVLTWGQSVANINNMPVVLPLVIVHGIDKASPKLVEAAIMGASLERAVLSVTRSDGEMPYDYIVLALSEPKIVSVNSGGAVGSEPVETVTMTCATFELRYRETTSDGMPGPWTEVTGSCGGS